MVDHPEGDSSSGTPRRTALFDLHVELGARMVDFAGFEMPIQYEGVVAEHEATRSRAGLFDVAHMGIIDLLPTDGSDLGTVSSALEALVPAGITTLGTNGLRYTMFTNHEGGVVDDLIVGNLSDRLRLVVNASRADIDLAHLRDGLDDTVRIEPRGDLALLALQGPRAVEVLAAHHSQVADLTFMEAGDMVIGNVECSVSRSGYTGEDGFEITAPTTHIVEVARMLLTDSRVTPCGLGARDTLRLEAGLCLYGHDLDEGTTPIEAGLQWSIPSRRRNAGDFRGAHVVQQQLATGPSRRRVGIAAQGRRPIRDGAELRLDGRPVGVVTSGGHGPTVGGPVAMGYVHADHSEVGTSLIADVRGRDEPCTIVPLPFVPHRYHRA